jgi:hypothetical protein
VTHVEIVRPMLRNSDKTQSTLPTIMSVTAPIPRSHKSSNICCKHFRAIIFNLRITTDTPAQDWEKILKCLRNNINGELPTRRTGKDSVH